MVSGAELAVIGTVTGSLIGGGLGLLQARVREKNQNQRHWTQMMFEHKYHSMVDLLAQYNAVGEAILGVLDIDEYLQGTYDVSEEEYMEIRDEFHELGHTWTEASVLLESESEEQIKRGLHLLEMMITTIADEYGYQRPVGTFIYPDQIDFESYEEFTELTQATQDEIRNEIKRPVEQFR